MHARDALSTKSSQFAACAKNRVGLKQLRPASGNSRGATNRKRNDMFLLKPVFTRVKYDAATDAVASRLLVELIGKLEAAGHDDAVLFLAGELTAVQRRLRARSKSEVA